MITSINEFRKLNEYHVDMPKKIQLKYVRTDDNGNFIYKGTDGEMYQDVEGVIHDVTDQGEPLGPVHNVEVMKGEPVYNPEDRFGRNPGSKVAESVINEESGDYSTDTHAIAHAISDKLEEIVKTEVSGQLINQSELKDLMHGVIKFEISDPGPDNKGRFYKGQIVVEIFDNIGGDDDSDGSDDDNKPGNYDNNGGARSNY